MRPSLVLVVILLLGILNAVPVQAADTITITVDIPDYRVTTQGGTDYVDLPGGEALVAEEGRPLVPYFVKSINYPRGQRVQNVLLKERSGLKTATGLELPVVIHQQYPEVPVTMMPGWYPEESYQWQVWDNSDGSTSLVITIFPFYYNPDTTAVEFYQKYVFDIESMTTSVTISRIVMDKEVYSLGDEVNVELFVNNASDAQDVVISLAIRNIETAEVSDGLPLELMRGLGGEASYNAMWESGNVSAGDYLLEATLTDIAGNVLDFKKMGIIIRDMKDIPPVSEQSSTPPVQKQAGGIPIVYIITGASIIAVAIIFFVIWRRRGAS